jgi:hypothetical protein
MSLSKDQRYRVKSVSSDCNTQIAHNRFRHLAEVREKDRIRAAKYVALPRSPQWASALSVELRHARENGTLIKVAQEWDDHREVGKLLESELRRILSARLPTDEKMLRDIFRQVLDLISTVIGGLAVLDTFFFVFPL